MKFKKKYSAAFRRDIWNIRISGEKLIVENRDKNDGIAFFSIFDLDTGKSIIEDFQFEEKRTIGINLIYKNIMFLHLFPKPDLPIQRGIIAFDLNSGQTIWTHPDLILSFIYEDNAYCYTQGFEERNFLVLNAFTGITQPHEDISSEKINKIKEYADEANFDPDYKFPDYFEFSDVKDPILQSIAAKKDKIIGPVQIITERSFFVISWHKEIFPGSLVHKLNALDKNSGKKLFSEILNVNTPRIIPEAFFIYKNSLFIIKEKNEIINIRISEK